MYGKMLKKVFGAATVCVAFGATELKADFKTDLLLLCERYNVDPKSETTDAFLKFYKTLYRDFKRETVQEMVGLRNSRLAEEKKIIAGDGVFCPGKSEIEMLVFAQRLWRRVEFYNIKCWEMLEKRVSNKMLKKSVSNKNQKEGKFLSGCSAVFMRRVCNLSFACIRFFAGRFALEKKLFDTKACPIDFTTDLHSELKKSVFTCCFRNSFEKFCKKLEATSKISDVLKIIIDRCREIAHRAGCARYDLEMLSKDKFCKINGFLKSVKNDSADVLYEKYKFKEKIDFLEQDYRSCIQELSRITGEKLGIGFFHEYQIPIGVFQIPIGVFSEVDTYYNRVEELKKQKTTLESKIAELKTHPYIEDRKLIERIFCFREYNAYLRLFFYCHTFIQDFLEEHVFLKACMTNGSKKMTNDFKEECDSMIKRFSIKRDFPVEKDYSAKYRAFSEDKEAPVCKFVSPNGKIRVQESFYNMPKNNNTTVFNKGFLEEMNKSSLY